jgi:hypothetical protein
MENERRVNFNNWIKRLKEPWAAYKAALETGDQAVLKKAEKQIDALIAEYDKTRQ